MLVKICGIISSHEASLAATEGADAIGLISHMPSGPGIIHESLIRDIARSTPPSMASFLLTSRTSAEEIIRQHRYCGTTSLQLCEQLVPQEYYLLREALPGTLLVQTVHVTGEEALEAALHAAPFVDALLLDSVSGSVRGGTGRTHDWSVSRRIRDSSKLPIYLAGGLNHENLGSAIEAVDPAGVDVYTGVRSASGLDERLLRLFIDAARRKSF